MTGRLIGRAAGLLDQVWRRLWRRDRGRVHTYLMGGCQITYCDAAYTWTGRLPTGSTQDTARVEAERSATICGWVPHALWWDDRPGGVVLCPRHAHHDLRPYLADVLAAKAS